MRITVEITPVELVQLLQQVAEAGLDAEGIVKATTQLDNVETGETVVAVLRPDPEAVAAAAAQQ